MVCEKNTSEDDFSHRAKFYDMEVILGNFVDSDREQGCESLGLVPRRGRIAVSSTDTVSAVSCILAQVGLSELGKQSGCIRR